jgi:hypothetical protein
MVFDTQSEKFHERDTVMDWKLEFIITDGIHAESAL